MSKKFKRKIKYCLKPQTVLTVQKENAIFAASVSTSVSVSRVVAPDCSGRIPCLPLPLSKPSLSADVQTKEPPSQKQPQANTTICDWRSCWRSERGGLAQRGPGHVLVDATTVPAGF